MNFIKSDSLSKMRIFSYFFNLKKIKVKLSKTFLPYSTNHFTIKNPFLFKLLGLSSIGLFTANLVHQELLAKSNNESEEKLLSVIMITRHGARTPLKIVSKLDEVNLCKN